MRHYLRGVAASSAAKGLALVLAFLLQLINARVMGAQWYGEYTYTLAWFAVLVVCATSGVDSAAVRFVAQYDRPNDRQLAGVFLAWGWSRLKRTLVLVIPAGVILGVALSFVNAQFSLSVFMVALFGLFANAGNLLNAAVLQGLKHPALAQVPTGILPQIVMIGFLCACYFLHIPAKPNYVIAMNVAAGLAIFAWSARIVAHRLGGHRFEGCGQDGEEREWRKVSNQLFSLTAAAILLTKFDIIMLGWFVPADEIGVYNVSARIAEMASLALVVSNFMVAPLIAQHYRRRDYAELQQLLTFSGRLVTMATVAVVAALVILGRWVLSWYGDSFVDGYAALLILAMGQVVNAGLGPVGFMLTMTGRADVALRIYLLAAGAMMLLALMLVPAYGMKGAALASASGLVLWNVMMFNYIVKKMKFDPSILGFWRCGSEEA